MAAEHGDTADPPERAPDGMPEPDTAGKSRPVRPEAVPPELARLDKAIAEMSARDVDLQNERTTLSRDLQAAMHQRALLANTMEARRRRAAPKPRRVLRRMPGTTPTGAPTVPRFTPRVPRQPAAEVGPRIVTAEPPPAARTVVEAAGEPAIRPEASWREVQNLLLGLGALLLAVAAVVYAAINADDVGRVSILMLTTGLALAAPPLVATRRLTSTAETVAAVGIALLPIDGFALWMVDRVQQVAPNGTLFAGIVFAATAVISAIYTGATGLSVPRYATVLALQPVVPLLAYESISGHSVGWALAMSGVAAQNLVLGRALGTQIRPLPIDPRSATGSAPVSVFWLRDLTWLLYGAAVGAALAYGVAAVAAASSVPAAARAGAALLLAGAIGLAGALALRQRPLRHVAAGLMTLSVITAAGRVAAVALPGRAILVICAVVAVTGLGVRALPNRERLGPQVAYTGALIVLGVVVAGNVVRAAIAPVRAALPPWNADLSGYAERLHDAVGPAGWQLAFSALLLTVAAVLALPPAVRHESAVGGAALTALAAPASLALSWSATPWLLVTAAITLGAVGLAAPTHRIAYVYTAAAGTVGLVAAGAAAARPPLTAGVLTALTLAGALIALAPHGRAGGGSAISPERPGTPRPRRSRLVEPGLDPVREWAAGGAAFALPGAVAATVASLVPYGASLTPDQRGAATTAVLAASFLAVCVTLGYAAVTQVARRQLSPPLALGVGLGALVVTAAAIGAPGARPADGALGVLLLMGAVLLFLAPTIDAGRRADRMLDGPDVAAAAVTAGIAATLARIAAIALPGSELAVTSMLVLGVALGVRAMPAHWRRGPILGVSASGVVLMALAGYRALTGGVRVLAIPGRIWSADLSRWPTGGVGWQAPVALALLAAAAAVVLPPPVGYDVSAACVGLATIGAPVGFGLPWWSPLLVGSAVATCYGVTSVTALDPRAARSRAILAAAVALYTVGAGLTRPWTTAAALGVVALLGAVVAGLARAVSPPQPHPSPVGAATPADTGMPLHLAQIGGGALGVALVALPGALAACTASLGYPVGTRLAAALAGSCLALAIVAVSRRPIAQYLPYATIGIAGGSTGIAIAAVPSAQRVGVYAAAAALLGVVAELIRGATPQPGVAGAFRRWSRGIGDRIRATPVLPRGRWAISPALGALVVAIPPATMAIVAIAPLLRAALVDPLQTLDRIWQGPPPELAAVADRPVDPTGVLTALLLTVAAALAALGFGALTGTQAVPVVLPGAAITVLITPIALGAPWPAATLAALAVFTFSMLGIALTPPPPAHERARALRVTRVLVFAIGLAAGGAGLEGSLSTQSMTLFTLGGAVAVGANAALGGRTSLSRILGWLFASVSAQCFALTAGLVAGLEPRWSAFGVLAVGAVLLVVSATLPRFRRPEAFREGATVEWSGYAAALLALALAYNSPPHLAALLAGWGAVLGVAAARPGRRAGERRALTWLAAGCEIVACWILMRISDVALTEAYTLPFATVALVVGLLELRWRPDLSSWTAFGPALVAAFLPTTIIVITTTTSGTREALLTLGAVTVLILGSTRRQQAPVIVGSVVTTISALHYAATLGGPWLMLVPVGLTLLILGATNESRRRTQERLRALRTMR
ncbi:MAG TPA: permease [Micromonosporaceae bacterium]|jgi:hypothetical protein